MAEIETTQFLLKEIAGGGLVSLILSAGIWFGMRHFMGELEKRDKRNDTIDARNQENLERFIQMQNETNKVLNNSISTHAESIRILRELQESLAQGKYCMAKTRRTS